MTKINELLTNKHKKSSDVFINKQGCVIKDQEIVANKFNNYFVRKLLKGLGDTNNKFWDYLKISNEKTFFLKEIDPGEVKNLFRTLM